MAHYALADDALFFNNGDVTIDREIGEDVDAGAWSGPADPQLVDFVCAPMPRTMRGS